MLGEQMLNAYVASPYARAPRPSLRLVQPFGMLMARRVAAKAVEGEMIRIVSVLTAVMLFTGGTAANDDDAGCAEVFHYVCTWAHAWKLAERKGDPKVLAYQALTNCKGREAVLAKFMSPEMIRKLRAELVALRVKTIEERRLMLARQRSGRAIGG